MSTRASSPQLLAARAAVARSLSDVPAGALVLVACSGGPDSLALAAATAWVGAQHGFGTLAVIVDHGLQEASASVAEWAARTCRALGVDEATVLRAVVGTDGGPEAAARSARYAALESVAVERDAATVLLGHTREDQAETVLLRLARGSGARSLSGMRERSGPWRRPFLSLSRADVQAVAAEVLEPLGERPWSDPHNDDPAYARVRVRALLDDLVQAIGPGAVLGLSRSAELLRDDADALDDWASREGERLVSADDGAMVADCEALTALPRAVRTRLIRRMCVAAGSLPDQLTADHVRRVEEFATEWSGQGAASLPCGVIAERSYGRLWVRSARASRNTDTQTE
ncbi:MAG: tRNA lysidine(34) synthetase TilS [Actinomycetes bacterium]